MQTAAGLPTERSIGKSVDLPNGDAVGRAHSSLDSDFGFDGIGDEAFGMCPLM